MTTTTTCSVRRRPFPHPSLAPVLTPSGASRSVLSPALPQSNVLRPNGNGCSAYLPPSLALNPGTSSSSRTRSKNGPTSSSSLSLNPILLFPPPPRLSPSSSSSVRLRRWATRQRPTSTTSTTSRVMFPISSSRPASQTPPTKFSGPSTQS